MATNDVCREALSIVLLLRNDGRRCERGKRRKTCFLSIKLLKATSSCNYRRWSKFLQMFSIHRPNSFVPRPQFMEEFWKSRQDVKIKNEMSGKAEEHETAKHFTSEWKLSVKRWLTHLLLCKYFRFCALIEMNKNKRTEHWALLFRRSHSIPLHRSLGYWTACGATSHFSICFRTEPMFSRNQRRAEDGEWARVKNVIQHRKNQRTRQEHAGPIFSEWTKFICFASSFNFRTNQKTTPNSKLN